MPGEEPCHDGERGALVPLGPALHRFEERPGAGLAGRQTIRWLLTGTEPLVVLGIPLGVLAKPRYNGNSSYFKAGHLGQLETV